MVFFAIGFETTAPGNAMAVWQAHQQGIKNFSVLVSHVLVPPAIASQDFVIQGPRDHGVDGLINLFGIESPGLTSSLAIADYVGELAGP